MPTMLNKSRSEVIKYLCSREEIEKILHFANVLTARNEAIVQLYHSVGLTQQRIADAFKICCELYERYFFNLDELVLIEVRDDGDEVIVDFKSPVWSGSDNLKLLWLEVEEELKDLLLRGLFQDGLQKTHKIVEGWRLQEHGLTN